MMTPKCSRARRNAARQSIQVPPPDSRERIGQLFAGFPASRRLYLQVRKYITSLGGVKIIPRKTQVGFSHGRLFAWVWLPQRWIKQAPRDSMTLTIGLDRRVTDSRIKESVEPYPSRHVHHIVLTAPKGLDASVQAWLREAYDSAAMSRQRERRKNGK